MINTHSSNSIFKKLCFILLLFQIGYSSEDTDPFYIGSLDSSLQCFIKIQRDIGDIHPFLRMFHPIVFSENDYLFIFDYDTVSKQYNFIKKERTPFPLPEKVRASFPLASYNAKPVCIITKDIFDSESGHVTIFHEFMHCCQFLICEQTLKQDLKIAQDAAQRNDYSWEITYSFPYDDSLFIAYYSKLLDSLQDDDEEAIYRCRKVLKQHLSAVDYEYMVWQEWKEGFARLIENRIQSRLGINVNHYGKQKPYHRVTFYYGGAELINYLLQAEPDLYTDIEMLFHRMLSY